jgi:hypothetical protein
MSATRSADSVVDHVRSAGELVTLHFEQAASKAQPAG